MALSWAVTSHRSGQWLGATRCRCLDVRALHLSGLTPAVACLTRAVAGLLSCRRRVGHWVTDATNFLPLLDFKKCVGTVSAALVSICALAVHPSEPVPYHALELLPISMPSQPCPLLCCRCRFTVQVPPWAPGWTATLSLRYGHMPSTALGGTEPDSRHREALLLQQAKQHLAGDKQLGVHLNPDNMAENRSFLEFQTTKQQLHAKALPAAQASAAATFSRLFRQGLQAGGQAQGLVQRVGRASAFKAAATQTSRKLLAQASTAAADTLDKGKSQPVSPLATVHLFEVRTGLCNDHPWASAMKGSEAADKVGFQCSGCGANNGGRCNSKLI